MPVPGAEPVPGADLCVLNRLRYLVRVWAVHAPMGPGPSRFAAGAMNPQKESVYIHISLGKPRIIIGNSI